MNMHHCHKQKQGFALFWVFKIEVAQSSCNGLKTKQHMKQNRLLLQLQNRTVCERLTGFVYQ